MEIIVADELPLVRVGLSALLSERSLPVTAEVGLLADLESALGLGRDVLVLLGDLPDGDLVVAARAARRAGASVAVMMSRASNETVTALELIGVEQFCLRHGDSKETAAWLDAALAHAPYRGEVIANLGSAPNESAQHLDEPLSSRELAVLALIIEGKANREIAAQLFITLATVKSHIQRIYAKLNVSNRNEALGRALALGLIAGGRAPST
ncbi:MAG: response regulator transcription factor [Acidimicrobiia bacterium]